MDVLIKDGDMVLTPQGEYVTVSGIDEIVQRVMLCAKIRKGSFIYNKNLGGELGKINPESSVATCTAQLLLKEAVGNIYGCRLSVVSVSPAEDNMYRATIEIEYNNDIRETVVEFSADL